MEKNHVQFTKKVVTMTIIFLIMNSCYSNSKQDTKDTNVIYLKEYITLKASFDKYTVNIGDSVTAYLEIQNISDSVFTFYPHSLYFIEHDNTDIEDYTLVRSSIQISPMLRIHNKKELQNKFYKEPRHLKAKEIIKYKIYFQVLEFNLDRRSFERGKVNRVRVVYRHPDREQIRGGVYSTYIELYEVI